MDAELVAEYVPACTTTLARLANMRTATARGAMLELLPRVVATICSYFSSQSSSVQRSASDGLALIVVNCIDESMVKEAVVVLSSSQEAGGASSTDRIPLPLEKVIQTFAGLLDVRFHHAWQFTLPLLEGMLRHFGSYSDPIMADIVFKVSYIIEGDAGQKDFDIGQTRDLLEGIIGAAIEAIGPRCLVTKFLPVGNPQVQTEADMRHSLEILDKRLWLLPLLRKHICNARSDFAFFITYFVALAKQCEALARSHDGVSGGSDDAKKVMAQMLRTRSMQVWELFPSFCTRPVKFVESFKVFAPVLGAALRDNRYPALQANVCRGLCVLLASSTNEAEVKDSFEDQQPASKPAAKLGAPPDLLPEERAANLEALAAVSQNFLPILFAQYQQAVMRGAAGQEMAQTALAAATAYAKVASARVVDNLCASLLKKLRMHYFN